MTAKPKQDKPESDRTDVFDDKTGAYTGNQGESATKSKDVKKDANG